MRVPRRAQHTLFGARGMPMRDVVGHDSGTWGRGRAEGVNGVRERGRGSRADASARANLGAPPNLSGVGSTTMAASTFQLLPAVGPDHDPTNPSGGYHRDRRKILYGNDTDGLDPIANQRERRAAGFPT